MSDYDDSFFGFIDLSEAEYAELIDGTCKTENFVQAEGDSELAGVQILGKPRRLY